MDRHSLQAQFRPYQAEENSKKKMLLDYDFRLIGKDGLLDAIKNTDLYETVRKEDIVEHSITPKIDEMFINEMPDKALSRAQFAPDFPTSYMTIRTLQTDLWVTEVDASALNKRAWTLQERLLSQRIIHFFKSQ